MYTTYPVRSWRAGSAHAAGDLLHRRRRGDHPSACNWSAAMIENAMVGNAASSNRPARSGPTPRPWPRSSNKTSPGSRPQREGLITAYTAAYEDGVQVPRPHGRRPALTSVVIDPAVFRSSGRRRSRRVPAAISRPCSPNRARPSSRRSSWSKWGRAWQDRHRQTRAAITAS